MKADALKKAWLIFYIAAIMGASLLFIPGVLAAVITFLQKITGRQLTTSINRMMEMRIPLIAFSVISCLFLFPKAKSIQMTDRRWAALFSALFVCCLVLVAALGGQTVLRTGASLLVLCLLLGTFVLLVLNIYLEQNSWRDAFIGAVLYYGVFIFLLTEAASFFRMLAFAAVLCLWLFFAAFLFCRIFIKYKSGNFRLCLPPNVYAGFSIRALFLILFFTFIAAAAYQPNTWDSMTYHLPRIEHWIQNKSVGFYFSSNLRQLKSAPFAEYAILQGRILSGGDLLANLVQWSAFAASLLVVSKIAAHFGLGKKAQSAAAVFFATVPMAILQASSTQTDMVESLWILCAAERFLAWEKEFNVKRSAEFGIALGLAVLTKGTAYTVALPLVLLYAAVSIKDFRRRLPAAFIAALIALAITMPHYCRNYREFREFSGRHGGTVSDFSFASFMATLPADIYINAGLPMPKKVFDKITNTFFDALHIDTSTAFPYGTPEANSLGSFMRFGEDSAKNPWHMLVVLVMVPLLLFTERHLRQYAEIVLGAWLAFAFCIPYQPWITRLQLPLFALSAPLFAALFLNGRLLLGKKALLFLPAVFALWPLFENETRPLLVSRGEGMINIFKSREAFTFSLTSDHAYRSACRFIDESGAENIGILIGGDSWEYPLWVYFRDKTPKPKIAHLAESDLSFTGGDIDAVFILERQADFEGKPLVPYGSAARAAVRNRNGGWDVYPEEP